MAQKPDDSGGKSWERPWSTEEVRQNADNWNLAADAGLLKSLQQFSQDVLSHTHTTEKALDSLLETINTTNTNINNVTNDFLCLANTQFLESRVYDDDLESPQDVPVVDTKQEPGDVDLMTKVRSALSIGINLLDTMFEPTDPNSKVENDLLAGLRNRSPKNPYSSRPLPHLIGSAAFMADDNVGLASLEKDTENPSAKVPAMDDLSMYSDESILTSSIKRNNMDDDSSNTSFCLGDDTPVQTQKPYSRDAVSVSGPENDAGPVLEERSFADELAGKLAGMLSPQSRVPPPLRSEESYEDTAPQNRPSKKKGDMFGIPPSDDEDDALFSGPTGLFSGGRGLFDDVDDADISKEVSKDKSSTPLPPPSKPRLDNDLFGSNSADEDNDDLFAVPAKKEPGKSRQLDVPPKPLSIGNVISQAAKRNVIASQPISGKADTPEKTAATAPTIPDSAPPPPPVTTDKKIPVGGRSMFGSAGLPIPKEALRRRPPSSSSEGSDDGGKNEKVVPNSAGGLFSSSLADEDDLFQSPAPIINQTPSAPPPKPSVKELTPKSSGDDDLFATPKNSDSSIVKSGESKSAPKPNSSLGLFDAEGSSEEDNLFNPRPAAKHSLFSSVPPPLSKSEEKSKKASLFDDSDSGDDEILFSSASSAGSRRSQASVDIFSASSVPAPIEKKPLRKGLFDDDSLFSSQGDGPDVDIFRGVGNDSGLSATRKAGLSASPSPAVATTKTVTSVVTSATTVPAGTITSSATSKKSASPVAATKTVSSVASSTNAVNPASPASTKTVSSVPTSAAPVSSATAAHSVSPASTETISSATAVNSASPASTKTVSSIPTSSAPVSFANSASPAVSTTSSTKATAVPSAASSAVASSSTKSSPAVTTGANKPSSVGGSFFDDDDDEDLFSVSKPPPSQKSSNREIPPPINKFITATTEDLFSGLDSQTKDINSKSDDLFGDLPEDDLFSDNTISSSISSSMFDNNPKVPVDDLFGTDEGDGDIFVPRKPTLTITDSIVESVKTVKVDAPKPESSIEPKPTPPEPTKNDSILAPPKPTKEDSKPTPPTTLDIRNTTDPNVVSSFDNDDEAEDLFRPLPVESKCVPEESLEEEKPAQPDKLQFVEKPKSVPLPRKPVPTARKPSFSTSEDESAKTEKPRPPEVLPKPATRTSLSKDEDKPRVEDKPSAVQPPPIKARTPLAGLGLSINPLALLPGAKPFIKKTPGEEPVGFDRPVENSSTLHFAQKERVRGSKRRPPSRRARQEAAKVVDHTGIEITSPSSVLSPSTDEDDLFGVPQDLPSDNRRWPFDGTPMLSPDDSKLITGDVVKFDGTPILSPDEPKFIRDDMPKFGGTSILSPDDPKVIPEVPKTVDDPLLKLGAETSSGTDTDADVTDDHSSLFAFVKKKPKELQPESLFSQTPTLPTKDDIQRVKNDSTDEDVEDDLFKPSAAVKKITDVGGGSKTWKLSDDDDDDDLFSTKVSSSKSGVVNSTKGVPKEVWKEERKPTLKNEPFSVGSMGLLSQPPPKKTERSLFDDDDLDDDDLFSSTSDKPPPLPISKGSALAQKKVANSPQWKDDLFDDPLSGR